MFNSIKSFIVGTAIFIFASSGAASPLLFAPNANYSARNASAAQQDEDEAELIIGIWRYRMPGVSGGMCEAEDIYERTGTYSSELNCNGDIYWHTGDWWLIQPGMIRHQIRDYEPKEIRGYPRHMISGETVYYRFIDRDHMRMPNNVIAYRVQ